ncbi:DUF3021 domain-containing protein [Levilactobacillus cerevisiae]|uniref:DUF3021 domain-containing protein n=1 Tax=Levilactobacillus cerevisiae TaxID=1704076 RepID=UPI00345E397D
MNKGLRYAMRGTGYGAVAYLVMMAIKPSYAATSLSAIVSLLVMSAAIGLISMIFDSERLNFLAALSLHFVGTLLLVVGRQVYVDGEQFPIVGFLVAYILIYVVVWAVVALNQHLRVTEINRAIVKRNKNKA